MSDVEHWLTVGGLAVLAAVVFAESGLLLGYFLGEVDIVKHNLDYAAIVIAVVSLVPILRELHHHRARLRSTP